MNPLWMPEGSVRSIVALVLAVTLAGMFVYVIVTGLVSQEVLDEMVKATFLYLGPVIGFYYAARQNGN